jgi:phosphoglycolate phosphatase
MHVIFDLDGTLVDTHPGIAEAFAAAMQEILPRVPLPSFIHLIGPPVREVFRKALAIHDEALLDTLNKAFRNHYDNSCWKKAEPYSGIPKLLRYLQNQGATCSVLTNKPTLPTKKILDHLNLSCYFSKVISPDSKSPNFQIKSEAAAYLLSLLNLNFTETWMIGDSEDDAVAAAACDFKFIAAAYGYGNVHLQDRHPIHLTAYKSEHLQAHFQQYLNSYE